MKKILLCLSLLVLAACIPVDDFGAEWGKGYADTTMVGKWRKYSGTNKAEVQVTERKGTLKIDTLDEKERKSKDYAPLYARTLKAGQYTFLMARMKDDKGKESFDIVRYSVKDGTLTEYNLSDNQMNAFLKKNYPRAKNIGQRACKGSCLFSPLKIGTLDGETVKILASIPDKRQYWQRSDTWWKVR